ncbi:TPA: DoxX family protein [bacterium]|nr:DoxX family protein [bacterium]
MVVKMIFRWLAFFGRLFMGGIFLYSSIPKITDVVGFAAAIENYRILPAFLIMPSAYIFIFSMLVIGIFLVLGFKTRFFSLLAIILVFVFTVALASSILRGLDIECGCFRDVPFRVKFAFFVDLAFLAILFGVFFTKDIPLSLDKLLLWIKK